MTAMIAGDPALDNAQTPYSMSRLNDGKEAAFEAARVAINPALPPRLKSLYVFADRALAERALAEWFPGETKQILECRVVRGPGRTAPTACGSMPIPSSGKGMRRNIGAAR